MQQVGEGVPSISDIPAEERAYYECPDPMEPETPFHWTSWQDLRCSKCDAAIERETVTYGRWRSTTAQLHIISEEPV